MELGALSLAFRALKPVIFVTSYTEKLLCAFYLNNQKDFFFLKKE